MQTITPKAGLARHHNLPVIDVDLATKSAAPPPPTTSAFVVVRWNGIPIASAVVNDDQVLTEGRLRETLGQRFHAERLRAELDSAAAPEPWTDIAFTVAVCTADRPESLDRCLTSLAALDHRCAEVLVVDNSRSSSNKVGKVVAEHGFSYLREPIPGLDRARNRALVSASTDIVIFTDDDVEIEPGWDRWLLDGFRDPLVMATAGLVIPAALDTSAQVRSEQFCSHGRGFVRRTYGDRHRFPGFEPQNGNPNTPGVGAAMAVRRQFVLALGGFPEELDAGTPTGTGGDTWMYRSVLKLGYRVAYEPRSVARHWHRGDDESLTQMMRANASGVWALNWRTLALGPDRRSAINAIRFTSRWHRDNLQRIRRNDPRALPPALMKAELRGMFASPLAYARSWWRYRGPRVVDGLGPDEATFPAPWLDHTIAADDGGDTTDPVERRPGDQPTMSIIIPTRGRRQWVVELVEHLMSDLSDPSVDEVIVAVDGDLDGTVAALEAVDRARSKDQAAEDRPRLRWVELMPTSADPEYGSGAGTARNEAAGVATGDILLFLDDDVLPLRRSLVARHRAAHLKAGHDAVVIGPALVDRRDAESVDQQVGRNWWVDHAGRLATEPALGITDVCSGNLSVPRRVFEELGRFPTTSRREDWFFGLRAEAAGVPILAAPHAAVVQRDAGRVTGRHDKRGDGAADAEILREFPRYRRYVDPDLWPETGRLRLVATLAGRHPRLQGHLEPFLYSVATRLPAGSVLRQRLGRTMAVSGYWAGAATAFGEAANPYHQVGSADAPDIDVDRIGTQPVLELTDPVTPPEVASGQPVLVTFNNRVIGTTSAYGQGLGTPIWKFRRHLVDRYVPELAKTAEPTP